MKETLSTSPENQPSNGENLWDMHDAPAFDPEAARQNIESAKNTDLNPESLKDVNKLQEQLEKLNVDKAIFDNPAFQDILNTITNDYDLQSFSQIASEGVQDDAAGVSYLRLDCSKPLHNQTGLQQNSVFIFRPDSLNQGALLIKSAHAERQADIPRKIDSNTFHEYGTQVPDNYRHLRGDGLIDGTLYKDESSTTSIHVDPKTSNLMVDRVNFSQTDWLPKTPFHHHFDEGTSDIIYSTSQSEFDSNGVENYQKYTERDTFKSRVAALASLGNPHNELRPALVLDEYLAKKQDINFQTELQRIDDTTMTVTHFENGKTINLPKVPINRESDTSYLTPDPETMTKLIHEASPSAN